MRHQLDRRWKVTAVLPVVGLLAASLSLAGCSQISSSAPCTMKQLTLTLEKSTVGSLPLSHDNDAGEGRIPDTHPDADVDANQRAALCQLFKGEHHLPG
ncbi:MAG: hypothetical protein ACYDB2_04720 [Acidimicrobiales bacterium]